MLIAGLFTACGEVGTGCPAVPGPQRRNQQVLTHSHGVLLNIYVSIYSSIKLSKYMFIYEKSVVKPGSMADCLLVGFVPFVVAVFVFILFLVVAVLPGGVWWCCFEQGRS